MWAQAFLAGIFWFFIMAFLVCSWADPDFRQLIKIRYFRERVVALGMFLSIAWYILISL